MTTAPLRSSLQEACETWPDRPAVTAAGTTITYADVGRRVARLAAAYRDMRIRPGDRILCQLPNSIEHVVALNAAWAVGAIHVGTDNDLTGPELGWLAGHTEAAALVFRPRADSPAALDSVPAATRVLRDADLTGSDAALDDWAPPHGPDDTAHLLLTSGTTGRPKAVMETRPACWAKMQFFADALHPGTDDVLLLYLPMAHVFGLRLAMLTLLCGGRLLLTERFSPRGALDLIGAERVTVLPGTPAHFTLLLGELDPSRDRPDSLRWAVAAASGLPRPLVEQIYARLAPRLLYVYGCSENFTVQTTDHDEILRGSVGRWVFRGPEGTPPDGRIAILAAGGTDPRPQGTVGEIAFGAARPVRYWKAPDAATDGWYRTGDLGRIDADGRVYLLGRLKELVNRGGLHVSPVEVETAMAQHPAVVDCAVVGTPDPVLGEAVCACVVPAEAPAPDLRQLRDFLAPTLARHKLPDELCVVGAIPRTKIGKVDRHA
ncbi:MAG: class I adenylate-forming enzyme family protein, partial [Acidimicrobiales bacterium]